MMQHGWRGGPQMRGGGMRGRGGGFNPGFRGRGVGVSGGGGGGGGGGGSGPSPGGGRPPRGDRSRSPIRGKHVLGEPAEWEMRTDAILDFFNSDLNLRIDESGLAATPLHNEGFAFMWGGARATYGVRSPNGKEGYPTHVCFEVRVGDKLPVEHLPPEESNPHVLRIGWSTDDTSFALGEEVRSWGYGGTSKKSVNCKFESYGTTFSSGDVVASFLEFEQNGTIRISYSVNGRPQGEAFRSHVREIGERAMFPHIYTKNLPFEINYGQNENSWFPLPENHNWTFIGTVPVEKRVRGLCPPQKIEDCEMLMMCGLPGAGKTFWAEKHAQSTPEKRFTVLGTNNILDKMKVMGLPRKRNYSGRWDVLIELSTKCLNKLFEIASRRKRNYILDQTNVYPSAQRRKMRPFESFHRKAIVVVPTDDEFKRRIIQRTKEEGKEVPESAVLEMKANFRLPGENDLFEDIIFTELDRPATEALVKQYNEEAQSWKRSGGSSTQPSINNRSDDSSGAKFRPDRNYGRSSGGGPSTLDDLSSVSSFGQPPRTDSESDHGGSRGRGDWRGGSRGGFRGGFNNDGNRSDSGRGSDSGSRDSGFRDSRGGIGPPRGGGMDQDRSRRGGFDNRRGGFQRDGGSRFSESDSGSGNRGGMVGQRQGFPGGMQSNEGDAFPTENRFQGDHGFQDRNRGSDQQEHGGHSGSGFGQDRNFGDKQGFGGRARSGFNQETHGVQEDMYGRPDQVGRMGMDPSSSYGGRGGNFNEMRGGGNFNERGRGGSSFGNRGHEGGGPGDRSGNFGDKREGGFHGGAGFGGERGGRFGDRGRPGDRGGRGRGFGDRGGRFGGERGGRGGFGGNRDFNQGFSDEQDSTGDIGGYRRGGYGDRSVPGYGDSGGSEFDNTSFGGRGGSDRSGGFGSNDRNTGYGGNERNLGGYGASERDSGGYGGSERSGYGGSERSSGYGGSERMGGYGGSERTSGYGGNDRSGGFGSEPSTGFGDLERMGGYGSNERGGGFGGNDRRGGYGSNRGFGDDKVGNYGERNSGGYGVEPPIDPMSSGRRPKMSRWSDAQPEEQAVNPPVMPEPPVVESSMSRSGGLQMSKGMGFSGYGGRSAHGDMGYEDTSRSGSDQYAGRQQQQSSSRGGYSQPAHNAGSGYTDPHQGSYDTSSRSAGYQDYSQSGYQSQSNVQSQESSGGYNYGHETSATSGYGSYSQPPPQIPQPSVSNYQGYGGNSNNYWQQPPPPQQQQQQQQPQQPSWQDSSSQLQQPQQPNWQQWHQPPPSLSQQQSQPGTSNEQWSYYQQPPPQDWQQQSGYQ